MCRDGCDFITTSDVADLQIQRRLAQTGNTEVSGSAFLFTFPFWIYVDRDADLAPMVVRKEGAELRVYPPFRSAPANHSTLPIPDLTQTPIPLGAVQVPPPSHIEPVTAIPTIPDAEGDQAGMVVAWGAEWKNPPRYFPMDSLRIDLVSAQGNGFPIGTLVDDLLRSIRFLSHQWWIGQASWPLSSSLLRYEIPIDTDGTLLFETVGLRTAGRTFNGTERPVDAGIWSQALSDIERGIDIPAPALLLLDAQFHRAVGDYRRFVLDASTAAEVSKDEAYERLWPVFGDGSRFKRGKMLHGYDLDLHVDEDLKRYAGRSYREEYPQYFRAVEDLWDARGNVAHGKIPFFRRDGATIPVDADHASRLSAAAAHLVDWLDQL